MDDRDGRAGAETAGPRRRYWPQTIFLGLFAAFGGLATLVVAIDWLQGVATYFWQESTCTVEQSLVVGPPESADYVLRVRYRYHVRGEEFTGDRYRHGYTGSSSVSDANRLAGRYAAGETVPCWVDPDEPWNAYLRRANLWRGLLIFVPLLFVAIPLGVLYVLHGAGRAGPGPPAEVAAGAAARGAGRAKAVSGPIKATGAMFVLFGAFFLMGFGMFIPFFVWPVLRVVEARSWTPVECEIISSGVRSHAGDDGTTYSVEALYRYRIDGQEYVADRYRFMSGSSSGYESKAARVEKIPPGARTVCFVDPEDPYEAVLDRGFGADFLFGLIPLLFGLIGAGGLAFAIGLARGARRDAARPSWIRRQSVEAAVGELAAGPVVLEPRLGPFGKLAVALVIALFWNGIVSLFVWQLVKSWRAGDTDWLLALFLTPFVLIGLLLLSGIPYSLLALVNPRPRVRLSPGVLRPGESAQLDWSFRGASGRIRGLEIWLEETRAGAAGGAETPSASREPRRIQILDRGAGLPVDFGSVGLRVPEDVAPTTDRARWKLKLHARIDFWPDVMEEYEIRVAGGGS